MTRDFMRRAKPRTFLARQAVRLAQRWTGRTLLSVDHPPRRPGPRYGYGKPAHAGLTALLAEGEETYAANLRAIASHADDLARIRSVPTPTAWPG